MTTRDDTTDDGRQTADDDDGRRTMTDDGGMPFSDDARQTTDVDDGLQRKVPNNALVEPENQLSFLGQLSIYINFF